MSDSTNTPSQTGQLSPDGQWRWDGSQWVPANQAPPKKKRRIFLWFFLIVQILFIAWIIAGIAGSSGTAEDCGSLSAQTCADAQNIGTGIGIFLIVVFWMIVDFFLALGYGIYRLASRR